jgi:hypothetical protein
MTTENPLAKLQETAVATANDEMFSSVASSGAFLPRLQLMTANSEKCKDGSFPTNHYARVHDSSERDLETSVDVLIIDWRPFAFEQDEEGTTISCYDATSAEFKRIQAKADESAMNGRMYGPQFLLWVPAAKEFMTFFMASKTARRASTGVKALMTPPNGQGTGHCTLGSQKIEKGDYTWFGPTSQNCTTPMEYPTEEETMKQVELFRNPPAPEVEKAEEVEGGREE